MTALMQTDLVREIAGLIGEYRKGDSSFVKFGMKGAIALNGFPAAGGIMYSPKKSDEHFKIGDLAFREKYDSERDAYFAALDTFLANAEFVAWDGTVPDPRFVMLEELSEKFTWHTMMVELVYRKRGADQEKKLSMFFIGFPDAAKAREYTTRHPDLLIATRPFSGKFHDWV